MGVQTGHQAVAAQGGQNWDGGHSGVVGAQKPLFHLVVEGVCQGKLPGEGDM